MVADVGGGSPGDGMDDDDDPFGSAADGADPFSQPAVGGMEEAFGGDTGAAGGRAVVVDTFSGKQAVGAEPADLDAAFASDDSDDPFANPPAGFALPPPQAGPTDSAAGVCTDLSGHGADAGPFASTSDPVAQGGLPAPNVTFPVEQRIDDSTGLPVLLHCHEVGLWLTDRHDTTASPPFPDTQYCFAAAFAHSLAYMCSLAAALSVSLCTPCFCADANRLHPSGALPRGQQRSWVGDAVLHHFA